MRLKHRDPEREAKALARARRIRDARPWRPHRPALTLIPPFDALWAEILAERSNEVVGSLFEEDTPDNGVIRLARWPEGYVLWYHGEIVWRSWTPG